MLSDKDRQFINESLSDDVKLLALKGVDPFIINQIAGRQKIKDKLPSWYKQDQLLYPASLSLEQSSSEITARYKSSLLQGDRLVDLTGGLGVDTTYLSFGFRHTTYVERNSELATIARHNFSVLQAEVEVVNADANAYLASMDPVSWIYIDPARRSGAGKKVFKIDDCEPDLLSMQDLLREKADRVLVKLSPMLDVKLGLQVLKYASEVHVVSVHNECKELLFLLTKDVTAEPVLKCVHLQNTDTPSIESFTFQEEQEASPVFSSTVNTYLYEPNASLMKAGFYKGIATRYRLEKLHPSSHLYTSSLLVADFPGRVFMTEEVSSFNKKELKAFMQRLDKANLAVRNFPLKTDELRRKLKLKEGGDSYLFATTLNDGKHVIIRTKKL